MLADRSLRATLTNNDLELLNGLFVDLKQEQVKQVNKSPIERSKRLPQISRAVQVAALALKVNRLRSEQLTQDGIKERDRFMSHLGNELKRFDTDAQANATKFTQESCIAKIDKLQPTAVCESLNGQMSTRAPQASSVKENESINLQSSEVTQKLRIEKSNVVPLHRRRQSVVSMTDEEIVKTLSELATKVVVGAMSSVDTTDLNQIDAVAKTRYDRTKSSNTTAEKFELATYSKMIQVARVISQIEFILKGPAVTNNSGKRLSDLESDLIIQLGSLRRDVAKSVDRSDDSSNRVPATMRQICATNNQFISETLHKLSQFMDNEISRLVDFRNNVKDLSDSFSQISSIDSIEGKTELAALSRILQGATGIRKSETSVDKQQQVSSTELEDMPNNGPKDRNENAVATVTFEPQRTRIVDRIFQLAKAQYLVDLPVYDVTELKAVDSTSSTYGTPSEIIVLVILVVGFLFLKCTS